VVKAGQAQRADHRPGQQPGLDQLVHLQRRRLADATRDQKAEGLVPQPPQRELERGRRARVEPLEVVDGEQDGPRRCQLAEDGADSRGHRAPIDGGRSRIRQEKRNLESAPLGLGQSSDRIFRHRLEQIGERREREPRLRLGRAAGEHAEPALVRKPDDLAPDRRLADPRLALEREHAEPLARRIEEFPGERELTLAPDDAYHGLESCRFFEEGKAVPRRSGRLMRPGA
jgi:hypothetical protein